MGILFILAIAFLIFCFVDVRIVVWGALVFVIIYGLAHILA